MQLAFWFSVCFDPDLYSLDGGFNAHSVELCVCEVLWLGRE